MTADELKSVEDYAGQFFTPEEVALILNLPAEESKQVINDKDSDFMRHHNRGVLLSKAIIRKGIIDMAKNGSGPAQVTAVKMMEEFDLKRISV
jgi:acetaldehyde dehydrogenase (acetylating)